MPRYQSTEHRNFLRRKNYQQTQEAPNTRKRWLPEEIQAIYDDDRPCDRELSALLGRSVQSIQVKRAKLALREANNWKSKACDSFVESTMLPNRCRKCGHRHRPVTPTNYRIQTNV